MVIYWNSPINTITRTLTGRVGGIVWVRDSLFTFSVVWVLVVRSLCQGVLFALAARVMLVEFVQLPAHNSKELIDEIWSFVYPVGGARPYL
jgi:hypothetical protein